MHLLTTLALASDWDEAHRLGDMAVWTSATAEARAAAWAEVEAAPERAGPPRDDVLLWVVYEAPPMWGGGPGDHVIQLDLDQTAHRYVALWLCTLEGRSDCDLRDVIDRTTALRQSSARVRTGDHPYLDAHFRWRDLAACCPNPVERRLPGPYDGSGSEIVVDGRTGRCEVWIGADLEPREVLAQHTCPAPPPTSPIAIVTSKPTKRPDRRIDVYSAFPIPRVWAGATASPRGLEPAIGASIGAGSTLVAFYETTPAGRFYGIGSHSLLGDTYEHERGHGMRCRVLHRHWVRPGLLLGRTVKDGLPGWRVRPEVTFGAYANLVVGLPVSWTQDAGWSLGARLGLALALP